MKHFLRYSLFLLLIVGLVGTATSQTSRDLIGGKLRYGSNEAFTGDNMNWPRGVRNMNTSMLSSFGVDIAVKMPWTDASGISWGVKVAEAADNRFTDQANVVIPVDGAFKRVFRNTPPEKIIDGKAWQDINSATDPVDANIPSDEMLYHHCTTWVGIDIERWTYSFENDANGDYVFLEWLFTNTSGEQKDDVYFGLRAEPATGSHYPGDLWGNYIPDLEHNGENIKVYYNYDADRPGDGDRDDRSDPASLYGNFTKPQYMGFFLIHADVSPGDETNDVNAPHKGGWSQRQLSPDLNSNTHQQVYDFFMNAWDPINPDLELLPGSNGLIRAFPRDKNMREIDSGTEQEKCATFSFGPYQIPPGEDVRIVMAFAGGALDGRACIDIGYAYDPGFDALRDRKPIPASYDFSSIGLDVAGRSDLTMEEKDMILDTGRDSMFANVKEAWDLWKSSSVYKGAGTFNVDVTPPSPSLTVTPNPGFIQLDWGTEAENADITGYNVYRNFIRPPSVDTPTDTIFIKVANVAKGTFTYKDESVIRGQDYYYYVTAVGSNGVESSAFLNRGNTGTIEEGASPTRAPDGSWQDNVVVVPNPYHSRGANKYDGAKLNFLNLPGYCNIHIYTMTGDKVKTLYHNSGTGDEAWDRQDTFSTMAIVSGIYLYVVEELDQPNGSPTGEHAIGKFIVVK